MYTNNSKKNNLKWNRIKYLWSFSSCHVWKVKQNGFSYLWKIKLTAGGTEKQMSLSPGKCLKVTKHQKERYNSDSNIRNRFRGVSNHLFLSLITFDSIVVCRDIKVDGVTKLPQWGTYEGSLSLIFRSCSTSHLHKSTQTFISNQEYKAVTHSLLLEMTALKPRWQYNNHIKLAHQHFKTLSVIICCITTPKAPPSAKLHPGNFPLQPQTYTS